MSNLPPKWSEPLSSMKRVPGPECTCYATGPKYSHAEDCPRAAKYSRNGVSSASEERPEQEGHQQ